MSDSRQRRAVLVRAAKTPELVSEVSPVVAAGFGVLALRRSGDTLTVACFPHANRRALRLLRDVLGSEIVASPFEERHLHEAIREAYFTDQESVNLPTFLREDFLEDPRAAAELQLEKVEQIPPVHDGLPVDQVVLGDLTYRSALVNLDRPAAGGSLPNPDRQRMILGDIEHAWREEGGEPRVVSPQEAEVRLILNEYRFTTYQRGLGAAQVSEHLVRAGQIASLPHIVHATEVQIVGIEADGSLQWHVYDHVQRTPAGESTRLEASYCFLSYGNRLRRRIEVEVHGLVVSSRDQLALAESKGWGRQEFGRWLDLSSGGNMSQELG